MPTKILSKYIAQRQDRLIKSLPNNSALVLLSGTQKYRNPDVAYSFRPDSDFYYLTGLTEPNSFVVLGRKDSTIYKILIIFHPTPHQKQWNDTWNLALDSPELDSYFVYSWQDNQIVLSNLKKTGLNFYCLEHAYSELSPFFSNLLINANYRSILDKLRVIKDQYEIDCIVDAAKHSSLSFLNILEQPFGSFNSESDIAALWYHYAYTYQLEQAYNPIIAGGDRACILHYQNNKIKLDASSHPAVLMDAGYQSQYYASDITRMILLARPDNSWSELYHLVFEVQRKVIEAVKPGVTLKDLQELTCELFISYLISGGFFSKSASIDDLKKCYMHSVGHHLGLDVHDCRTVSKDQPLKESMVITIEPGLYFNHPDFCQEPWANVGIRIEDDLLVTKDGCRELTTVPARLNELVSHV